MAFEPGPSSLNPIIKTAWLALVSLAWLTVAASSQIGRQLSA